MAMKRWLGIDGNLANTANWTGGTLPTNGDAIIFDYGTIDISSGLSTLSAVAAASISITTGFKANIGAPGTSLQVNTATLAVSMAGSFVYWSGTATGTISIGSTGTGAFYMTAGDFSSQSFVGGSTGKVFIAAGVTMGTNVYSAGCAFDISSAFTNALLMGGSHIIRADVTNLTLGANVACTLEGSGVDCSNAYLYGGSRLTLNNGGATAGILSNANAYPGSTIVNGGKYDNTITTLYQWSGSTQVLRAANAVTTVGTTTPIGQK